MVSFFLYALYVIKAPVRLCFQYLTVYQAYVVQQEQYKHKNIKAFCSYSTTPVFNLTTITIMRNHCASQQILPVITSQLYMKMRLEVPSNDTSDLLTSPSTSLPCSTLKLLHNYRKGLITNWGKHIHHVVLQIKKILNNDHKYVN